MPSKRIVLELSESNKIRLYYFSTVICGALIVKNNQIELLERYLENEFNKEKFLTDTLLKHGGMYSKKPSVSFVDNDKNKESADEFSYIYDEKQEDNVYDERQLTDEQYFEIYRKSSNVSALKTLCKKLTSDEPIFSFLIKELGKAQNDFNDWFTNINKELKLNVDSNKSWNIDFLRRKLQIVGITEKNTGKFVFEHI